MKTIVVATDFSPASQAAFRFAVELAGELDCDVVAVYVINTTDLRFAIDAGIPVDFETSAELKKTVMNYIDRQFERMFAKYGKGSKRVRAVSTRGNPAAEVLKAAKKLKADLIAAGTRGLSPAVGFLLGSVVQELIRNSSCPVITVRAPRR